MINSRSLDDLTPDTKEKAKALRAGCLLDGIDLLFTSTHRDNESQAALYAQGRTKPGKIVTWTLNSKHIDGLAVDLAPIAADGSIPWSDSKAFDAIAKAMFEAANVLEYKIRWGADWDGDGKPRERGESDSPHFELA